MQKQDKNSSPRTPTLFLCVRYFRPISLSHTCFRFSPSLFSTSPPSPSPALDPPSVCVSACVICFFFTRDCGVEFGNEEFEGKVRSWRRGG